MKFGWPVAQLTAVPTIPDCSLLIDLRLAPHGHYVLALVSIALAELIMIDQVG